METKTQPAVPNTAEVALTALGGYGEDPDALIRADRLFAELDSVWEACTAEGCAAIDQRLTGLSLGAQHANEVVPGVLRRIHTFPNATVILECWGDWCVYWTLRPGLTYEVLGPDTRGPGQRVTTDARLHRRAAAQPRTTSVAMWIAMGDRHRELLDEA